MYPLILSRSNLAFCKLRPVYNGKNLKSDFNKLENRDNSLKIFIENNEILALLSLLSVSEFFTTVLA